MPSSPPASLQQRVAFPLPTKDGRTHQSRQTSFAQGGVDNERRGGDMLGLQMNKRTADLGGLEVLKRRRGMVRGLELEWREKWDEREAEEEGEGGGGLGDALGLELGKRKFDELDDDQDRSSPPSPPSSSSPATLADRPPLSIIRLVVPRVPVQQQEEEEEEELQPSTDFEDEKEETLPSSESGSDWLPSSNKRATRSKGKTSMRLIQDRSSPSVQSSSPSSSSKRRRTSSSPVSINQRTRRRRLLSPALSSASPENGTTTLPSLPLDRNASTFNSSSSAFSSIEPSPPSTTKNLPTSAYSSLAAASSYPQPGSQTIDDDGGEEHLVEPFGPPSPTPSSPLSSAPPSPQPNANLPLPPSTAASPLTRRSSARPVNVAPVTRRTFQPNLKIEPGFDRFYRNFSIPTPLSNKVTSALGLPAQNALVAPRPMALSAKRHNSSRGPMDLYSPRWVQGMGREKTALCPICFEDEAVTAVSFKTKCSAFNYHLLHAHGISPSTGLPFSPPMDIRSVKRPSARPDERNKIRQGKCHECKSWIPIEGVKNIDCLVPEIFFWKHARECHKSRLAGDRDIWKPSAMLDQLTTWIDGLGAEEKAGWIVPSKHRSA
ncbi:hypothetical protein BDY24DRAFT_385866 [Mrakia frigida]|uniref:DUF4451 domain-containing protein n=1 Tax=Mrakia frigida TaxID=29902 RepID=UPI003FCBF3B2